MRSLITGADGQLGKALADIFPESTLTDAKDLDITNSEQVKSFFAKEKPEVVFNCAAFTDVDGAEDRAGLAYEVNGMGVYNLARECDNIEATLVTISTDYVFDGANSTGYSEDDSPNPLSVYGKSKLFGELAAKIAQKHYIVRTSWLFGDGKNFVKTMLRLAQDKETINVVGDQIGRPTYAVDLAEGLAKLLKKGAPYGTYHISNSGSCSWAEFAETIFKISGLKTRVIPIKSEEYPTKAVRPKYSILSNNKINKLEITMPQWEEAVETYLST